MLLSNAQTKNVEALVLQPPNETKVAPQASAEALSIDLAAVALTVGGTPPAALQRARDEGRGRLAVRDVWALPASEQHEVRTYLTAALLRWERRARAQRAGVTFESRQADLVRSFLQAMQSSPR